MSDIERTGLENAFRLWKDPRMQSSRDDDAFERFSIEQILKDAAISDSEIKFGNIGGGSDGGIDGFYFFIDGVLVQEDMLQPQAESNAELFLIQSTLTPGFSEDRVQGDASQTKRGSACTVPYFERVARKSKNSAERSKQAYRELLQVVAS